MMLTEKNKATIRKNIRKWKDDYSEEEFFDLVVEEIIASREKIMAFVNAVHEAREEEKRIIAKKLIKFFTKEGD